MSKAGFRATREMVGISQQRLAELLGVTVLSVKRWENPEFSQLPPEEAWEILKSYKGRQAEQIEYALSVVEEHINEEEFNGVDLTYWRSADHFESAHKQESGEDWQVANATSRLIAHHLEQQGIPVSFDFPGLKKVKEDFNYEHILLESDD